MDLYYAVRRFYFFHITRSYKAYFLHTDQSYIFREQFLLLAPMTTYLKDLDTPMSRKVTNDKSEHKRYCNAREQGLRFILSLVQVLSTIIT